jgi:hypothetical protein
LRFSLHEGKLGAGLILKLTVKLIMKKNFTFLAVLVFVGGFMPGFASALVTTSSATLDGGASVTVLPGATINVSVIVDMTAVSNIWNGTSYLISTTSPGTMNCFDSGNNSGINNFTENFSIIAPTIPGTYNAYFQARGTSSCGGASSIGSLLTLPNAIIVSLPVILDTTSPIITLTGNAIVDLNVGDSYADLGATAIDDVDGDLTGNIVVVNPVDTATAGTYIVTYNVSDAALNSATQVARTVNVLALAVAPAPAPTSPAPSFSGSSGGSFSGSSRRNLSNNLVNSGNSRSGEVLGASTDAGSAIDPEILAKLQKGLTDLANILGSLKNQIQ